MSDELRQVAGPDEARRFALGGGDDYEICFKMPEAELPDELPDPVTAIGRITGSGELVCLDDGVIVPFDSSGYPHFR